MSGQKSTQNMSWNKFTLTLLSLLSSFTIAGFGSQIGLLVAPMAGHFDISITEAAAQFSWLLTGVLIGNFLALFVFRYVKIKWLVVLSYGLVVAGVLATQDTRSLALASAGLTLAGIASGIGVCAATTIIAAIWHEEKRGSILVGQDAFYNGGGIFFPIVATFLLSQNLDWNVGYVAVAVVALIIMLLALIANFDFAAVPEDTAQEKTEWHLGTTLSGLCLMLVLMCSLFPIIWLPEYLKEAFGLSTEEASTIIPSIFWAALAGSIASALIVLKMPIRIFIILAVILGAAASLLFAFASSVPVIELSAYVFGVAIAAVYHSFIAYALGFVKRSNYLHVTYMYLCGGIGGALAPVLSSWLVESGGIASVFLFGAALYAAVLVMIAAAELTQSRSKMHMSNQK